ncbi:uncharacterized protein LOC122647367 [Telopea speciosissima]|uniref:uncharacterized protein LOC122647367 n=1 Tax=Telopea speciosissima TaxID=54955 RepID=UPI001CC44409|nr:uncharacterized protein LOC122647367 [Telopea speciosissima]
MVFFFFFFFTFASIIPVLLASRDIEAPSPSDEDIEDYTLEGFGEPAESPEDDYEVPEEYVAPAPAPVSEEAETEIPPEPQPGFYDYVKNCVKVIPEKCGQPIVDAIYKNSPLDGYCCHKVVEMGKDCHLALVKVIELVDKNESHVEEISQRGLQVWNHCVSLVSPSPSP